jgi:hypothetical protein
MGRDTRSIQRYLGNRSIISTARSVKDSGRIDAANRERAGTLTPRLQSRTPSVAPPATGSVTATNTIGSVRVACCKASTVGLAIASITSGASAVISTACFRMLSASGAQRYSNRALPPISQPKPCKPCRNAPTLACVSESSAAKFTSTPMRRTRLGCCARAVSGHVAPRTRAA